MFGRVMPPPIYTVLVPSETVSPPMAEGDEIKDATWATAWIIWGGQHRPRVLMGGGGSVREAGVQGAEAKVLRGLCRRWSESGTDPPRMPRPREEPALPTPRGPRDLGPPQLRETFLVPKPLDL